jgi:NMD protein affecting ribosome stability and mRNA decay
VPVVDMEDFQNLENIIGQKKSNQMIKKQCFICGKKTNEILEGKCKDCLKQKVPLIKELKKNKFFICNYSKKIGYKNSYYSKKEFLNILPKILKKNIILNKEYKLNNVEIENFEIDGHRLIFDTNIDYDYLQNF